MKNSSMNTLVESTTRVLLCSVLALCSILLPGFSVAGGQNGQFVLGEVIIKFKDETEANQLLSRAIQSSSPNIGILAPVVQLLSDKTGIPLKSKQILSGGWLLLAVDMDKLASQSVTQLRKRDTVIDIQLRAREFKAPSPIDVKDMDVTFRSGSPELKAINEKLASGADERFSGLIRELGKALDLPLEEGKIDPREHLILQVDLRELTILASERLRALSEITDSVQLNYMSTMM